MNISQVGIELIKSFESFQSRAYWDVDAWAIGYAHRDGVQEGDTCTLDQANAWLAQDCAVRGAEIAPHILVTLNQNEYDSIVSLVYDIGAPAFITSTLLEELNAGNFDAAAREFLRWDHSEGIEIAGLERRRQAESQLFQRAE